MENDINITKILKDKSENTMLYSSLFGNVYLYLVDTNFVIVQHYGLYIRFLPNAKYSGYDEAEAEPTLFPSKEMRDWSKFSWKRGDILVSNDGGTEVIFDKWYDDTYTSFYCKHYLNSEDETKFVYYEEFLCTTERYAIEDKDKAQIYIGIIEERLGGKLNRETLEVEKAQPEFKDGDIVTMHKKNCDIVFIFNRLRTEGSFYYYAFHTLQTNNTGVIDCHITLPYAWTFFGGKMNFATDLEKQQLFSALEKEGKRWDSDKKSIVDLKTKCEFKPFDKVVVRCSEADRWSIDFFSYKVHNGYICTGDAWFEYCLPYNEETEKLVGTTNNVGG